MLLPALCPHKVNFFNFFFIMEQPPVTRLEQGSNKHTVVTNTNMHFVWGMLLFWLFCYNYNWILILLFIFNNVACLIINFFVKNTWTCLMCGSLHKYCLNELIIHFEHSLNRVINYFIRWTPFMINSNFWSPVPFFCWL